MITFFQLWIFVGNFVIKRETRAMTPLVSFRMIPSRRFLGRNGMASVSGWVILFVTTTLASSHSRLLSVEWFSDRDWPFWKTNSPRKCASTPTAPLQLLHSRPSFPLHTFSEAYTISNWPDLAFRVPYLLWLLRTALLSIKKRHPSKIPLKS